MRRTAETRQDYEEEIKNRLGKVKAMKDSENDYSDSSPLDKVFFQKSRGMARDKEADNSKARP